MTPTQNPNTRSKHRRSNPFKSLPRYAQIWGSITSVVKAVSYVLLATGLAYCITYAIDGKISDLQLPILLLTIGALLRASAAFNEQWVYNQLASSEKHKFREKIVKKLPAHDNIEIGSVTSLATYGLDERDNYFTSYLPAYIDAMVIPFIILAWLYTTDWLSGIIVTVTLPLIPIFMILVGKYTKDQTAAALDSLTRFSNHLIELARGLPVLMGLGRADEQAVSIKELSDNLSRRNMETLRTALLSALVLELLATISVAVVAVFVGVRLLHGQLTLETGLIALLLAPECFAPFRRVGGAYHASNTGNRALERIKSLVSQRTIRRAENNYAKQHGITLKGVSVQYDGREGNILSDVSYVSTRKGVVLLEGESGSGKTTMIKAITSQLPSSAIVKGTITSSRSYALLTQHPTFSQSSVRKELLLYSDQKYEQMDQLITGLRLTSLLDEDPDQLSPGEKRRVAFAGVYLRATSNPRHIVVLDEPTAHVDRATAEFIIHCIKNLQQHSLIILASHDVQVQALANDSIVLGLHSLSAMKDTSTNTTVTQQKKITHVSRPRNFSPIATGSSVYIPLLQLISSSWRKYAAASLLGVLAAGFAIALTSVSGWLIVRASEQPPVLYLMVAIVGVRFFGIGRSLLYYWSRLAMHNAVFTSASSLRVRLWNGLARQGPAFRSLLSSGNTMDRIVRDSDRIQDLLPRLLLPIVTYIVLSICIMTLIIVLIPSATQLTILVHILLLLFLAIAGTHAHRQGKKQLISQSHLTIEITKLLENAAQATANGYIQKLQEHIYRSSGAIGKMTMHTAYISGIIQALCIIVIYGYIAGLLFVSIQTGTVLGPILAIILLTPLGLLPLFDDALLAIQKWPFFLEVLRRSSAITETSSNNSGKEKIEGNIHKLALNEVSYQYPNSQVYALSNVSFDVSVRRWLVVSGASGSGKSTLLALLLKNLLPTQGSYAINDYPTENVDSRSLQMHMSWCPQESFLFNSTLRGNLLIARPRSDIPSDKELLKVLNNVGLSETIGRMEKGLDTAIGSEGHALSGGERQRLALARTLLAKTDVILLDEPTAHIDEQASKEIIDDLQSILRKKIVIIVSHEHFQFDKQIHRLEL